MRAVDLRPGQTLVVAGRRATVKLVLETTLRVLVWTEEDAGGPPLSFGLAEEVEIYEG